jgi:hypothetical protein
MFAKYTYAKIFELLHERLVGAGKRFVAADFRAFSTPRAERCGCVTGPFIAKP